MIRVSKGVNGPETDNFVDGQNFEEPQQVELAGDKKNKEDQGGGGNGTDVLTKPRTKTKKPRLYKVLLLNDDYTPMDFVISYWNSILTSRGVRQQGLCCRFIAPGSGYVVYLPMR